MTEEKPIYRINRKLRQIGWSLRLIAFGEAALAFLITVALAAAVLLALGKLLYLPPVAREVLLLIAGAALSLSFALYLARPLVRGFDRKKAAIAIEERYPDLKGQLLSAWELQNERESGNYSTALIDALTGQVSERIDRVEPKTIRDTKKLRKSLLVLCVAVVGLALLLAVDLDSSLGALRLYTEGGGAYSGFEISVSPGDARVPYGSDQVVTAVLSSRLPGGSLLPGGAIIRYRLRSDREGWREDKMKPTPEGAYSYEFRKLHQTLGYYISLRQVRSRVFTIDVLEGFSISSMELKLKPPAYTGLDEETQRSGDIKALPGTEVRLNIWPNREVRSGEIVFGDGRSSPLEIGSDNRPIGKFIVSKDSTYHIAMVDVDGYANEPAEYRIVALPDNPPSVRLTSPDGDLTVSEGDTVSLQIESQDDYGLARMELRYQIGDRAEAARVLKNYQPYRRSVSEALAWDLKALSLSPGDTVFYYITVWDADTVNGPKSARTGVYQLTIPTIRESISHLQGDQEGQLQALGEIARLQKENKDETGAMLNKLKNMREGEELDWTERKKLEQILERQENIKEEALKLAEAIRETLESIESEELRRSEEREGLSSQLEEEETRNRLESERESDEVAKRPEGELKHPPSERPKDGLDRANETPEEEMRFPLGEMPQEDPDDPEEGQDRNEQDPMSSPQVAEKMEKVREMLERLSTKEMQEAIRRLMQANQGKNLSQLKNQLEMSKMSQEEFLQAMEQLMKLLEKAYEEQKMMDLANFARKMLEEEKAIRLTTRFFNGYDDLSPEQEQELSRLADRQEQLAEEDMKQFRENMGKMKDPDVKAALDELAKQMDRDRMQGNMMDAGKDLRERKLSRALSRERKAEEDLSRLTDALQQMYNDMVESDLDQILAMVEKTIRRALYLSRTEEELLLRLRDLSTLPQGGGGREGQAEIGEIAERELSLRPQLGLLRNEIANLVQGTPQVGMELLGRVSGAMDNLDKAVEDLKGRRPGPAAVKAKDIVYNLNQLVARLLKSQENLSQQQMVINLNQAMERLGQLAQMQQGINQETGRMTEGGRRKELTGEARERLRRLSEQQREVRQGLEELERELKGDGNRLLGDLNSLAREMKKVEEELGAGSPSADLIERQIKIFTRLLNLQKSLHRRDFEEKRQAEVAKDYPAENVGPTPDKGSPLTELRRELIKTLESGKFPPGYEKLLERYFRALSEYSY